jgi:hypothetical protein
MKNQSNQWPQAGEKVIFKGCPAMYYPHFLNMQTFCKDNLTVGKEYELSRVEIHSSWVSVWLVGFKDVFLNWSFFRHADKPE